MADITGRSYEAFVEFLLLRLSYRDEWTEGTGRQYLYEKHPEALCYRTSGVCNNASECQTFSKSNGLPYGPWYNPDFFILDGEKPTACIHVTHWSNPSSSQYKFWRTIEDHLEYKINFGKEFLSLNMVFVALDPGENPKIVFDSDELVALHGWKPATGSVLAVSFDSSILFPLKYFPLEEFTASLPVKLPATAKKRRTLFNELWMDLYNSNKSIKDAVDYAVILLKKALQSKPSQRYTSAAITKLQQVCWEGRQQAVGLHPTESRYRKGLQHVFIVRELISREFGTRIDPDTAMWSILTSNPRFAWKDFRKVLNAGEIITEAEIDQFRVKLTSIPIQMKNRIPVPLLNGVSGLNHAEWNIDLKQFIQGLRYVKPENLARFKASVTQLFVDYRGCYGMDCVLDDLSKPKQIKQKVDYVYSNFIGISDKKLFKKVFSADMRTPGLIVPHQAISNDIHNWPADLLLEFYDLGSMQHITTSLPAKFEASCGHLLRPYAYMNNLGQLISHLIAGVPVGQYFSNGTQFTEPQFYKEIWPLFAECLWEAIGNRQPLSTTDVETNYRYKKAMRIISSPDLEPISFLLRQSVPSLSNGPTLRGCFNQLSVLKKWGRAALTTETTGFDAKSGATVHTQAVFGPGHITDKTKELAGRMRSNFIMCDSSGQFQPEKMPGLHLGVLDGDWPLKIKINLLEAGYARIFEIAELSQLTDFIDEIKK